MNVVKIVAIILVVFGATVILGFIFHEILLSGPRDFNLRFGRKEITGSAIGVIIIVLGLILLLQRT